MVQVLPGLPPRPGGADRHACSPCSSATPATPTSCSTGRWPWSTTTSRSAPRPRSGCGRWRRRAGSAWGPGTSSWTSSSPRVRPSCATCRWASDAAPPSAASWRSGYLPDMFGHIAQMPQILRLAGFHDAVVWRGVPSQVTKNAFIVGVARRLLGPGRVPARRLRQRCGAARRRQGAHPPDQRQRRRGGRLPHGRPAVHERLGPPDAPTLARAGRGRGERPAGRVRLRGDLAPPLPGERPHRGTDTGGRRAPLGRPGQHAHGRHLEPGRRQAPRRAGRAGTGAARRAAGRAVPGPGGLSRPPAGAGLAGDGAQLGPRLHLRLLGRRRRRRRPPPLRRSTRHRRRAGRPGRQDLRPLAVPRRADGAQPVAAGPLRRGRARRAGRRPGAGRRAGAVRAVRACPDRWCSTPTPCARCSG